MLNDALGDLAGDVESPGTSRSGQYLATDTPLWNSLERVHGAPTPTPDVCLSSP